MNKSPQLKEDNNHAEEDDDDGLDKELIKVIIRQEQEVKFQEVHDRVDTIKKEIIEKEMDEANKPEDPRLRIFDDLLKDHS